MHLFAEPEFWVFVAFAVFVGLIWVPARRMAASGLDSRAARIRDELDQARNLREEAQRTLAAYREKEREAAAEAQQIVAHARAEAERAAAQSARHLEESLQRRRRLAEERIAQEEAKALAEIRAAAVDVAVAAARRVIRAELDEKGGAILIDQAIAALPQQLTAATAPRP